MSNIMRDFWSKEERKYNFQLGRTIASSLTGFVCGVVVSSIIWYLAVYFI